MAERKLESITQANIIKYLESIEDVHVLKIVVANKSGEPDLVICYKGLYIAFEVKREGEMPTQLQTKKMEEIEEANGLVFTVWSLDEVKWILRFYVDIRYKEVIKLIGGIHQKNIKLENKQDCGF